MFQPTAFGAGSVRAIFQLLSELVRIARDGVSRTSKNMKASFRLVLQSVLTGCLLPNCRDFQGQPPTLRTG